MSVRLANDAGGTIHATRPRSLGARGTSRRLGGDAGVSLVIVALSMTGIVIMVALVVDLGFVRQSTRVEQSVADMAALASGTGLASRNPYKGCSDAVAYINSNARDMPAINAVSFCTQLGNDVRATVCSGGLLGQAKPSTTSGRYQVSIHYPVPSDDIKDPNITGPLLYDKLPCDRMRVIITATDPSFFGGIIGTQSYTTTRSATAVSVPGMVKRIPALWLLDPHGCVALDVSGGSQVEVGTSTANGVIMVDSDAADSSCNGNTATVDVGGSGTKVIARSSTTATGFIGLYALPPGAVDCSVGKACQPADVTPQSDLLSPTPSPLSTRATRAPVDWRYDCKPSYPAFPAVQSSTPVIGINPCPDTATTGPYITQLRAALSSAGTARPSGFTTTVSAPDCSPNDKRTYTGNVWVNCPGGYSLGSSADVSFTGGNVVFTGDLKMTGQARVSINSTYDAATGTYSESNPATNLTPPCLSPGLTFACTATSSKDAAYAFFTKGGLDFTGGVFHANHTAIIMSTATGQVKVAGGSPPYWTAPTEGAFRALSLWAEGSSGPFSIAGGAGVTLSGAFFTPEGVMSLTGGGDWAVPQNAQFISYQLKVSGGGVLRLSPDPNTALSAPPMVARLIR